MPERKDAKTKADCHKCKAQTWHIRYTNWILDEAGTWQEVLRCEVCGTEHERPGLPLEQDRLNELYAPAPVSGGDMALFDSMESDD